MGNSRTTLLILAFALMSAACGSSEPPPVDTTRRLITTTFPVSEITTSSAAPATSAAPTTTTLSPAATTTVVEDLPDSIGGSDDPAVAAEPSGAQRFFYAGNDANSSARANVLGDAQVLYYDVYAPSGTDVGLTALYLHGGALDAGYANDATAQAACRQLSQLGVWCVSIEYRRGFAGFDEPPTTATAITQPQGERFAAAFRDARNDALEAWFHLDALADTIGLPSLYAIVGEGAGAMIAGDITLATGGLPYDIAGSVLLSGTHLAGAPLAGAPEFPVVIQSGLFDEVSPAYVGRLYLDADMPAVVGAVSLFDQLAAAGSPVRLYLNAQQGHGLGVYRSGDQISFLAQAVQLILEPEPSGAFIEYRFTCNDANFGAAGPGVIITTAEVPSFRYEPYQSDLASGLTPVESVELHPLELTNCQG